MNAKHYVSLEAAKKLKELGYNKYGYTECTWSYDGNSKEWKLVYTADKRFQGHYLSFVYSAPTLLEAMDWLESKGIYISINASLLAIERKKKMYSYGVLIKEENGVRRPNVGENWYSCHANRNECMQKAIEMALELL